MLKLLVQVGTVMFLCMYVVLQAAYMPILGAAYQGVNDAVLPFSNSFCNH